MKGETVISQLIQNETLARWEQRASRAGYSVEEYISYFLDNGVEPMPR